MTIIRIELTSGVVLDYLFDHVQCNCEYVFVDHSGLRYDVFRFAKLNNTRAIKASYIGERNNTVLAISKRVIRKMDLLIERRRGLTEDIIEQRSMDVYIKTYINSCESHEQVVE